MFKITDKSLMLSISVPVQVGTLTATVETQVCAYRKKSDLSIEFDSDIVDFTDIEFMGLQIEGRDHWNKFKTFHLGMGVDIVKALIAEYDKVLTRDVLLDVIAKQNTI